MARVLDSHHHLWHYDPQQFPWISEPMSLLQRDFLPRHLAPELQASGVDAAIAVQARQSLQETDWLLQLASQHPFLCGVVGWLPLCQPDAPSVIRHYARQPLLKGVRHLVQDEPDDHFLLRSDFNRGIASLLDFGLVYDILIHERHLPQAIHFVRQHPQQTFVLDHLAKPPVRAGILQSGRAGLFQTWKDNLLRLAESPNVCCKLSGLVTEANWESWTLDDLRPYLDAALQAFGPARLMAGSDWPVCLLASSHQRWWRALQQWAQCVSPAQQAQIFGGTAEHIYRTNIVSSSASPASTSPASSR